MIIVDTHVHVGGRYVHVEELINQMNQKGVDKAVLVQYRADLPPPGNTDNTYHVACLNKYPSRLASVGIVDWTKEDALPKLEYWAKQGIQGLRLDGEAISPGQDKYAIWRKAAELGIIISVYNKLDSISQIAELFPNLKIHVEHCGQPTINEVKILDLAVYPNVFVKFSVGGLSTLSKQQYPYKDTQPFFENIFRRYGSKRIMWSSDYPASGRIIGYDKTISYIMREIPYLSWTDRKWIMGKTALTMWRFEE